MAYIDPEDLAQLIFEYCDETMETASLPGFAAWILDNDTAYQIREEYIINNLKAHKDRGRGFKHHTNDDCLPETATLKGFPSVPDGTKVNLKIGETP